MICFNGMDLYWTAWIFLVIWMVAKVQIDWRAMKKQHALDRKSEIWPSDW